MGNTNLKLSVTIITKNEEANIERCLKSVDWADEIVVVDSESTDRTVEICEAFASCKVFRLPWEGFGKTKQKAVDQAGNDWILSIDADEQVSPELREKILDILSAGPQYNGYRIKRRSFYLGKLMRYSGWNSDYQLRLFNKKFGRFNKKTVHESVQMSGPVGRIEEVLFHYTYPDVSAHVEKMDRYASLAAEALYKQGDKASLFEALLHAKMKFLKMYIVQLGFLDGRAGLILALNSAYGAYLKYLKLWKKHH